MDANENARISQFLAEHKQSCETITPGTLKKLVLIDGAIQRRIVANAEAMQALKANGINISAISKETGISNKTFYNNQLLNSFVMQYSTDNSDESCKNVASSEDVKRLREQNAELSRQIELLVSKDVSVEKLHAEIDDLHRELRNMEQSYKQLQEVNEQLRIKNHEQEVQIHRRESLHIVSGENKK